MDAVIDAPNKEVALAQINAMKGYSKKALNLPQYVFKIMQFFELPT